MAQSVQTRMTAAEFAGLPESNLPVELIDGEVISSPVPLDRHQVVVFELARRIEGAAPDGHTCIAPLDVYLNEHNVVQPDVFWVSGPDSCCKLGDDGYWHGPPDLVVEVLSPATSLRDKREKFQLYEKHGVREYWLADPGGRYVEVWRLEGERFQLQGVFGPADATTPAVLGERPVELKHVFD